MAQPIPRVLFIDAYDSFTNNIISLLEEVLRVRVSVLKIDVEKPPAWDLRAIVRQFDAVVAGPGPGNPLHVQDVGIMDELWRLGDETGGEESEGEKEEEEEDKQRTEDDDIRPVLGVCLGFQSLALYLGASITRLAEPKHGIVSTIAHQNTSIFAGVKKLRVTRYHSLQGKIGVPFSSPSTLRQSALSASDYLWKPTQMCPYLQPLAWVLDEPENGNVLMALKHTKKPYWGVQYHPESICSNEESAKVIENWWGEVKSWHAGRRPSLRWPLFAKRSADDEPELRRWLKQKELDHFHQAPSSPALAGRRTQHVQSEPFTPPRRVLTHTASLGNRTLDSLYNHLKLGHDGSELVVLDSAVLRAETGRYSIVGFIPPDDNERIEYIRSCGVKRVRVASGKTEIFSDSLNHYSGDVWRYLDDYMQVQRAVDGTPDIPFWGGLIGFVSYEACLESIGVQTSSESADGARQKKGNLRPESLFVLIERSLVIDRQTGHIYIQSIRRSTDEQWMSAMASTIAEFGSGAVADESNLPPPPPPPRSACNDKRGIEGRLVSTSADSNMEVYDCGAHTTLTRLKASAYQERVRQCQQYIRMGESYELCLTNQAVLRTPRPRPRLHPRAPSGSTTPGHYVWRLYERLRARNPAPFAAYFRAGAATVLSCSPERFLRWDRRGRCQMRPIKGTVSKAAAATRQRAEQLLRDPKEQAENLMIVDLIRHDMHGVLGSGAVAVTSLMAVEEYERVYQLVSVIEGCARRPHPLPPGPSPMMMNDNGCGSVGWEVNGGFGGEGNGEGNGQMNMGLKWLPEAESGFRTNGSATYGGLNGISMNGGGSQVHINGTATNGTATATTATTATASTTSDATAARITAVNHGIRLLGASLPPGSMTGAPKKRSCELLQTLEGGQPRGIYSGVFGYICAGGGGDFSVMIRSAFKWDDGDDDDDDDDEDDDDDDGADDADHDGDSNSNDNDKPSLIPALSSSPPSSQHDYWRFGAGGAVTALSDAHAEWLEMETKLWSTLAPFIQEVKHLLNE